jgi:hypothetical protein
MILLCTKPKTRFRLMQCVSVLAALSLQLASPVYSQSPAPPAGLVNVGDAKLAAISYYKSGAYGRDVTEIAGQVSAWLKERAPQVSKPAVVFDIDDTLLSNWTVITANDFGRVFDGPCRSLPNGPCGWVAWDLKGKAPAIAQMLAVHKDARAAGIATFFITGRDTPQRAATIKNLARAGYSGYAGLYMPARGAHYASAADFKTLSRKKIEEAGYTIIANVGDQPSDLAGGHAERTFLVPNPFYRIP